MTNIWTSLEKLSLLWLTHLPVVSGVNGRLDVAQERRKGCLCLNYAQSNWCWSYDKRHKNITKYNTIFALQKRNWGGTIFASCDKYSSTTTKCTTYVNLTLCWFKLVYVYGIKIENKTYRTVPKSNSKFVERCKINSLNTQIHDAPFSCSVQTLQ